MNRRDFTKSLAALGLAPALPALPGVAAASAAPSYTPYMYGLGAHMARAAGHCSADMLIRKLCLTPGAARAMQTQLIRSGIVTAPNAAGLAAATQPYMRSLPAAQAALASAGKSADRLVRKAIKARLDHREDPSENDPSP